MRRTASSRGSLTFILAGLSRLIDDAGFVRFPAPARSLYLPRPANQFLELEFCASDSRIGMMHHDRGLED